MKKYLMTGIAALAMCFGFTSCSHDVEPMSQEDLNNLEAQKIVNDYNQAFLKYVGGTISPDQTWGFGGYDAVTRVANTNGNEWYKTHDRPYNVNLSSTEIAELKALLTKTGETYNTQIFPYENYYVEQIYKGGTSVSEGQAAESDIANDNNGNATNTSVTGSNQMDWLHARSGNEYTHINNFNWGNNTTEMVDDGNGTKYIGITLMENMSLDGITATNQFAFTESWGTQKVFYNNYLIVKYKGEWYVGFDYEGHKGTDTHNANEAMQVERNWAFTDWIVRISPADHEIVDPDDVCIIAEDLSANEATDFDFNDVVFTVHYNTTSSATVTLYAAGGTLPLWVGDASHEVHKEFGYPDPDPKTGLYKMINTGAKADVNNVPVVSFNVTSQKSTRGKDIIIKVDKGTKNDQGVHVPNWIELTATGGAPAAKVCVGVDFATENMWCFERQSIKDVYRKFSLWVAEDPTVLWWRN